MAWEYKTKSVSVKKSLYLLHCPAFQGSHISIIVVDQLVLNWFYLSFCGTDYGLNGFNNGFLQKYFLENGVFLGCRLMLSFVMVDLLILGRDMSNCLHIEIRTVINFVQKFIWHMVSFVFLCRSYFSAMIISIQIKILTFLYGCAEKFFFYF